MEVRLVCAELEEAKKLPLAGPLIFAPGCDEPTSRCQTLPSIGTLGQDQPVIPRVQSVALRLIVERERLIQAFVPQEYWDVEAELRKAQSPPYGGLGTFKAKLDKIDGQKAAVKTNEEADRIAAEIRTKTFVVREVKQTEKKRNPDPPFITSTLQQEAFNKLKFNAAKTMLLAQQLYEGIDIGEEAPVGLITYMRTDSTNIAAEAIGSVRAMIQAKYGADYVPEKPPVYKTKKFAQEAHEAIRPTSVKHDPQSLRQFLDDDQYKLYELIYLVS